MRRANIIISLILMAFTGFYTVLIIRLPVRDLPHTLGAAFVPWVLAGCLLTLSLLLLGTTLLKGKDSDAESVRLPLRELVGILGFLVTIIIYIQLMTYFGFLIASIVFLSALITISGSRKIGEILFFSIATSGAVYWLFYKFFEVQLPVGELF